MTHAIILLAHGSRDPQWRAPIEAVAAHIRQRAPDQRVACAYLELSEPDLPTLASELIAEGIDSITVFPLFLGMGKHARQDLPALLEALRLQHPRVKVSLLPSAGEQQRLLELLASIALET